MKGESVRRRQFLKILGGAVAAPLVLPGFALAALQPVRIMCIGDSITQGFTAENGVQFISPLGGYRGPLQLDLLADLSIEMVGRTTDPESLQFGPYERATPHGTIPDVIAAAPDIFAANTPDVVMILLGHNDCLNDVFANGYQIPHVDASLSQMTKLVTTVAGYVPDSEILVGRMISPSTSLDSQNWAGRFNMYLPRYVDAARRQGANVRVANTTQDMTAAHLVDGIHLTPAGYQLLARNWASAFRASSTHRRAA